MQFIMENWLIAIVAVYIAGMILYGHYKGFIRTAVSIGSMVISLVVSRIVFPCINGFIKQHTSIYIFVENMIARILGINEITDNHMIPAAQRIFIEKLNIPDTFKDILIENNNSEIYHMLGVDAFASYIKSYLANIIMNVIVFIITMILVAFIMHLALRTMDFITDLPVISGINQITGAVLGAVQAILIIWVAGLVIKIFADTFWAKVLIGQIDRNIFLSFIYYNNIISVLIMNFIKMVI